MRCLGRTQTLRRCKREGSSRHYPFCHDHRWQPAAAAVSLLGLVVLVAEFRSEVWERYIDPDRVVQKNALAEMCSLVPDISSTFSAMAAETRAREAPGRSENRDVLNDQLARLNSAARKTGNPELVEAASMTRTKWVQVFSAPPIHNVEKTSPTALRQRWEYSLEAMQAMGVIADECIARGLLSPSAPRAENDQEYSFKRSREGLINLLASSEVDAPLEMSDEVVLGQYLLSRLPEVQGLRASVSRCCQEPRLCTVVSGAPRLCQQVRGSLFLVIAVDSEYYLGGKVLTIIFKNPPHPVYFAWMKDTRLVVLQEFNISAEEKGKLLTYYHQALEAREMGS